MYSVIGVDGREYGPVDMKSLEEWIQQGRVTAATVLIDPISGQRGAANQFPAVQDLLMKSSNHGGNFPPPKYSHYGQSQAPRSPIMKGRNKVVAALLAIFFGAAGIHQFYLGKTRLGIVMLLVSVLSCGYAAPFMAIWAFVDAIIYLTGGGQDVDGYPLTD